MALEWLDGFELASDAAIAARYTSGSFDSRSSTSGRTNQYIIILGPAQNLKKTVSASASKVVGFAMKQTAFAVNTIFLRIMDGSTVHVYLQLNATDSTISVYQGDGTLLATTDPATQVWTANFWIYLEFFVTIDDTAGEFILRANEAEWLNVTGADTRNGGNASADTIQLCSTTNNQYLHIDDFYIANLDAPMPAGNFYGNLKIEHLGVSGAGATTEWTPLTGSNYQNVDENPPNSDTDYNYSSTVNEVDTYTMEDASASTGSIRGVQLTYCARKDASMARETAPVLRSGGTDYVGGTDTLTTSYVYYSEEYDQDPATAADWTFSDVNALEAGVKVIT